MTEVPYSISHIICVWLTVVVVWQDMASLLPYFHSFCLIGVHLHCIFPFLSFRSGAEPGASGQRWGWYPLPRPGLELPDGVWLWAEGCVSGSSVHPDWRVRCGGGRRHGEHEPGRLGHKERQRGI